MRPKDFQQATLLTDGLLRFGKKAHRLPGLISPAYVAALVEQILEAASCFNTRLAEALSSQNDQLR